ncbi:MAG TPA: hypothetical protein VGM92_12265, partial [Candidatus Kapabacteria bacterium]
MKKAVFIALSMFFASHASAQGVGDSLIVNLKNGQRVTIPLSTIQKITFDSEITEQVRLKPENGLQIGPNFPNPAGNGTNIVFTVPDAGIVTIALF